jgi:hypothetical protein
MSAVKHVDGLSIRIQSPARPGNRVFAMASLHPRKRREHRCCGDRRLHVSLRLPTCGSRDSDDKIVRHLPAIEAEAPAISRQRQGALLDAAALELNMAVRWCPGKS